MDDPDGFAASTPKRSRKGWFGLALLAVVLVAQASAIVVLAGKVSGQETRISEQEDALAAAKNSVALARTDLNQARSDITELETLSTQAQDSMEVIVSVLANVAREANAPADISCIEDTDIYGNITDVRCSEFGS